MLLERKKCAPIENADKICLQKFLHMHCIVPKINIFYFSAPIDWRLSDHFEGDFTLTFLISFFNLRMNF